MNVNVDTVQLKNDLTEATGCDIRLCWSTKHFGKKNKNPLDFMRYGVVIRFIHSKRSMKLEPFLMVYSIHKMVN